MAGNGRAGLGRRHEFSFARVFEMPVELSDISGNKCLKYWPFENQGTGSDVQQAVVDREVNGTYYRN